MTNPIKEMKDSNGYEVKFSLRNCPCILKDHNYSNVLCYPIKLPSQLNLANDHVHVHNVTSWYINVSEIEYIE